MPITIRSVRVNKVLKFCSHIPSKCPCLCKSPSKFNTLSMVRTVRMIELENWKVTVPLFNGTCEQSLELSKKVMKMRKQIMKYESVQKTCQTMFQDYTGDRCEVPSVCANNLCAKGATCFRNEAHGNYSCACPLGKVGQFCDQGNIREYRENRLSIMWRMLSRHIFFLKHYLTCKRKLKRADL